MVHRDPETGQFLAHDDDEPLELTYADHEFVNARIGISNQADGADDDTGTEYAIEDSVLGLENDELGMLSWLSASLCAGFTEFSRDDTTQGGAQVAAEIGANLSGDDFLFQADTEAGITVTDTEPDTAGDALVATDSAGLWAVLNTGSSSPYKQQTDSGDDYSGNADFNTDRMRRVYSEETRGGPYIDSTDDINVGIYTDRDSSIAELRVELAVQMSFVVFEYENRRAEFAPYDPGTGMD